jgi:hypothetical protein
VADGYPRITRREALVGAAMLGVGAGVEHVLERSGGGVSTAMESDAGVRAIPFHGVHQAGIATPTLSPIGALLGCAQGIYGPVIR